ncbi:unnamed protein product, partial [Cyprideis torosa]
CQIPREVSALKEGWSEVLGRSTFHPKLAWTDDAQISRMSYIISNLELSINAGEFVTFSRSLFMGILGTTITYCVILLQFEQGSN